MIFAPPPTPQPPARFVFCTVCEVTFVCFFRFVFACLVLSSCVFLLCFYSSSFLRTSDISVRPLGVRKGEIKLGAGWGCFAVPPTCEGWVKMGIGVGRSSACQLGTADPLLPFRKPPPRANLLSAIFSGKKKPLGNFRKIDGVFASLLGCWWVVGEGEGRGGRGGKGRGGEWSK